jgi:bacterioferritin
LAERINYIGGTVTMDVGECKTAVTTLGMLTIDLEGEQVAIKRYQERIAQAEKNNDPGTAELIREILIDEEQHENDLVTYMNKKA